LWQIQVKIKMAETNRQQQAVNLAKLNQQMAKNPVAGTANTEVFLNPVIDFSKTTTQNTKTKETSVFQTGNDSFPMLSDEDAQMIATVHFTEHVEVTKIILRADKPPHGDVGLPKEFWILKDVVGDPDFTDLDDEYDLDGKEKETKKGAFGYNFKEKDFEKGELRLNLPPAKFRGTTKLTFFFKDNQKTEDDEDIPTFFNALRIVGKPSGNKGIDSWEPCKS